MPDNRGFSDTPIRRRAVRTFAKIVDENAHPWKAASPRISPPREIGATLAAPYVEASRDETSLAGARESPLLAANSVARLGLCDRPSSLSDTLQNSSTHYAIGDIHGRRDLLDLLLSAIEDDAREREARARPSCLRETTSTAVPTRSAWSSD
jgi:hypothetical protein